MDGKGPHCITLNHRELPSLHHEEIIVKREEVAIALRLRFVKARWYMSLKEGAIVRGPTARMDDSSAAAIELGRHQCGKGKSHESANVCTLCGQDRSPVYSR